MDKAINLTIHQAADLRRDNAVVTSQHLTIHEDSVHIQTYYSDQTCVSKTFTLTEHLLNGAPVFNRNTRSLPKPCELCGSTTDKHYNEDCFK